MSILTDKNKIRKKILSQRDNLILPERITKSLIIEKSLLNIVLSNKVQSILSYIHTKSEVETNYFHEQILGQGLSLAIPKVKGKELKFFSISNLDKDIEPGYYGINEPKESLEEWQKKGEEWIIIPGVVFDQNGNRLGYGKGFYDRFLRNHSHLIKVGLAFECQLIKKIPVENHEEKIDFVITEKKIYDLRQKNWEK